VPKEAIAAVEESGIVFIDEIDKIVSSGDYKGADASSEGVQRDLLPLIEGSAISTKHGNVNTDYILFIASGAFHSGEEIRLNITFCCVAQYMLLRFHIASSLRVPFIPHSCPVSPPYPFPC
jgi:hypothetical protein